jgi:hypothetical protein
MILAVVSDTALKTPPMVPSSRKIGLYEYVK